MPRQLPFAVLPIYYNVARGNVTASLPANFQQKASYKRVRSFTKATASVYFFQLSDSIPETKRYLRVQGTFLHADYAVFYSPQGSKDQQWVAVSKDILSDAGDFP